jgi:hypothetical protein
VLVITAIPIPSERIEFIKLIFSLLSLFLKRKNRHMKSPFWQSVHMCIPPPPNLASQWLSKQIPVATNTHETTDENLDAFFSMYSMSCQRKVCVLVCVSSPVLAWQRLSKYIPVIMNNKKSCRCA